MLPKYPRLVTSGAILAFANKAYASSTGSLPWEGPLQAIQESLTGPVAASIGLSAVAVAGAMLIFGGELNDFARRMAFIILVLGVLLGASTIVGLFSSSGASIGPLSFNQTQAAVHD